MPRAPRTLPSTLGDIFTIAEAAEAGVTAGRLRAADLEQPFRGVRTTVVADREPSVREPLAENERPPTKDELAHAATLRMARAYAKIMGPHEFFAGRTAAVLRKWPIEPGDDLVIAVQSPRRPPRRRGIRGVKVSPNLAHTQIHDHLRMTTPATTWAMLAGELSVRELVSLGDAIVRVPRDERGDLCPHSQAATVQQLARAITAGRRVGVGKLREALEEVRVGSASPLETDFRLDAAAGGLPEFELDVEIHDDRGTLLGITELVHRETRTVIEVEGDHHRRDRRQWNRDIEKYAAYAAEGWAVVRLTSKHIRGARPTAVKMVRDVLIARGWRPA
ncbi:hypothetical protein HF576_04755 [Microbacterium sp. CFH 90308]|uniref:DUF559 domain-containing protein n=1 Tax=Microbacterium salsuginis TaxID=2722803 RepID=A0ABX1K874_9MICO|nr:hypothetical protein [Microbacterium sp. CFH 90308]NLP83149.1 hypothetical protein [Microbacterium sp. CFH 90308]